VIAVEDAYKTLEGVQVLKGASFRVEQGELAAVIGVSGEGKSVLLRHIAGLMKPDAGRVLVDGQDMTTLGRRALAEVRSKLGYVFQNCALFDSMSVFDNVAFPLREKTRLTEAQIRDKALQQLAQVGLGIAGDKFPGELSGGMLKRAALARALVSEPKIMLFDEPTTGLDRIIRKAILDLINTCHKQYGFTGIIVTHQIPEVFGICQKVIMLHSGVAQFVGPPLEIMRSDDPVVQQFVSGDVKGPLPLHTAHWRVAKPGDIKHVPEGDRR